MLVSRFFGSDLVSFVFIIGLNFLIMHFVLYYFCEWLFSGSNITVSHKKRGLDVFGFPLQELEFCKEIKIFYCYLFSLLSVRVRVNVFDLILINFFFLCFCFTILILVPLCLFVWVCFEFWN